MTSHPVSSAAGRYQSDVAGPLGVHAVPLVLPIAAGLPLLAVLFADSYRLPTTMLVIASLPTVAVLVAQRALVVPRSVVLLGMVLFVLGTLLSTVISEPVKPIEIGTILARGLLAGWLMYVLALIVLRGPATLMPMLLTLVLACGINAAANSGLLLAGDFRALGDPDLRLVPVVGMEHHESPTTVSTTYAVMLAAAFAIAVMPARRRWVRPAAALAGLAMALALALTETPSGYLAALAGIVAVAASLWRRAVIVVGAAIVFVAAVLLYPPTLEALFAGGGSDRIGAWLRYLALAAENPLVGTGLTRELWLTVEGGELNHAHNVLISSMVRGGLIGLAGMALMLGGGLFYAWRLAAGRGGAAIFGMVVAMAVAGVFDHDLVLTSMDWMWLTFWMPLGLAAGAELAVRRASSGPEAETIAST